MTSSRTINRGVSKKLRCEKCRKPIEELTEEQALADMEVHGWTDWKTAHHIACYHCWERFPVFGNPFTYETYFAGRYEEQPDGSRKVFYGNGLYFVRDKEEAEALRTHPNAKVAGICAGDLL